MPVAAPISLVGHCLQAVGERTDNGVRREALACAVACFSRERHDGGRIGYKRTKGGGEGTRVARRHVQRRIAEQIALRTGVRRHDDAACRGSLKDLVRLDPPSLRRGAESS